MRINEMATRIARKLETGNARSICHIVTKSNQ